MIHPVAFVGVSTVVVSAVVLLSFHLFKVDHSRVEVVIAAFAAALIGLVPQAGGTLATVFLAVIFRYRTNAELFPDIIMTVLIAEFAVLPGLLLFVVR